MPDDEVTLENVGTITVNNVDAATGTVFFTTGYTLTPRYNYVITNPATDVWAGTAGQIITYTGTAPEPLQAFGGEWFISPEDDLMDDKMEDVEAGLP